MSAPQPQAPWDYPRNTHGVAAILDAAEERGVPREVSVAGTTIASDLSDPGALVGADQELQVIRNVLARLGDDGAGLGADAGSRMTLGMLGVWGFAQLASPTLVEAGRVALHYGFGQFSFVFSRPFLDTRPGASLTVFDASVLPDDVRDCLLERDLVGSLAIARQLLGEHAQAVRIETTLAPERVRHIESAVAPCTVVRTSGTDALVVPDAVAQQPLPLADPIALAHWLAICEQDAATRVGRVLREPLAVRVRHAIRRSPAAPPTLATLATSWHVDERSIRRRLAAEGTSYSEIVDELRRDRATQLLGRGLTVAETAGLLGFANSPSFSRAFKRWTGEAPSRWRADR